MESLGNFLKGHITHKWQSWGLNPGSQAAETEPSGMSYAALTLAGSQGEKKLPISFEPQGKNPLPPTYYNSLSVTSDRRAAQHTWAAPAAHRPSALNSSHRSELPAATLVLTSRQINAFRSSLSSPVLGRPGRSCSFQASFILNSVSKQHFPPSTPLIPGRSPPHLSASPTVSTTHFLSPIRTIKVHTLLTGKQGRNIFFFSVFLTAPSFCYLGPLPSLSTLNNNEKEKEKKGMRSSHKAGTILPTVFCTTKFTFLKYCLNLFSKNIFL